MDSNLQITVAELQREEAAPVIMADHNGLITYINDSFESQLGWTRGDLLGKSLITIIPSNLHDAHHLGFSRFVTTGAPTLLDQPLNLKVLTKDQRVIDSEHVITAEQREGKWVFAARIRPTQQQ